MTTLGTARCHYYFYWIAHRSSMATRRMMHYDNTWHSRMPFSITIGWLTARRWRRGGGCIMTTLGTAGCHFNYLWIAHHSSMATRRMSIMTTLGTARCHYYFYWIAHRSSMATRRRMHYDNTWHSQMPLLFLLDCSPLVDGDKEDDAL